MKHKPALFDPRDIALAVGLLTRLPVPVDTGFARDRGAAAAWAYPLAGVLVAVLAALAGSSALGLGLPAAVVAGLVIAAQVLATGAMHEDGLADSADGLWGGWSRARRLDIMKDSRIGTYGVLALILSVGLRWMALAAVITTALWPALIAAALLSRAAMVAMMAALPHARPDGLSRATGRPPAASGWAAIVVAAAGSMLCLGFTGIVALICGGLVAGMVGGIAHRKLGGQTGDILGATQQVCEITVLAVVAAQL